MTRSTAIGKFLILSKDGINDMFKNEKEYNYKIVQIEPSFDDDYMVEVVEKGCGYKITASIYDALEEQRKRAIKECGEDKG